MSKETLDHARKAKKDEFYTELSDIQEEIDNYTDKFKGKVVFCNCDDPFESNFVKYFLMNFNRLELKKLIATGYRISGENIPYALSVSSTKEYLIGNQEDLDVAGVKYFLNMESSNIMALLMQDPHYKAGDFRSDESIKLLKQSDIVVTNPPFSLFREFITTLTKYEKQFLIIGNLNAITYKEVFPLIKNNKLWLGASSASSKRFYVPDEYPTMSLSCSVDKNGRKFIKINNARWFTNIDHIRRHTILPLDLVCVYEGHEDMYPKYDNYNAIHIEKTKEIPCDYKGVMGVPITFLDKYCPEQFEIVKFRKGNDDKDLCIKGKCPYFRILIKRK